MMLLHVDLTEEEKEQKTRHEIINLYQEEEEVENSENVKLDDKVGMKAWKFLEPFLSSFEEV